MCTTLKGVWQLRTQKMTDILRRHCARRPLTLREEALVPKAGKYCSVTRIGSTDYPTVDTSKCCLCGKPLVSPEMDYFYSRVITRHRPMAYRSDEDGTVNHCCVDCRDDHCYSSSHDNNYYHYSVPHAWFTLNEIEGERRIAICKETKERIAYAPDGEAVYCNGQVDRYHGGRRNWPSNCGTSKVYGIELEILAKSEQSMIAIQRSAVECGLAAERDSSLDSRRGVEIVGPPVTFEQLSAEGSVWMKFIDSIQTHALGWDAGQGYGMHVNCNANSMSKLTCGKVLTFIGNQAAPIAKLIAGRAGNSYARYGNGRTSAVLNGQTDKYMAVSLRSPERLEFRLFRSTIRWDRFYRNVMFCMAVCDFCSVCSVESGSVDFLKWLSANQHFYPELAAFFYASEFSKYMTAPISKKSSKLCSSVTFTD